MYYTKKIKTISLKVKEPEAEKQVTSSSKAVNAFAKAIYKNLDDDQEHFTILFLNSQNEVNGFKTVFSGGQNQAHIDKKVVFRYALQFGASRIIAVHNHPSGVLKPSPEDNIITEAIVHAGILLDIPILDHLIITNSDFYSFADEGKIKQYENSFKKV